MKYVAPMLAAVGVVGVGIGMPHVLSRFAFFEIRQVEIFGVQHLAPDQILDAAGLEEVGNLFRDLRSAEERIASIPGVVSVELERRLPGTLRILIEERPAVAFAVATGTLVALDADARPLPYDPTVSDLDLPVVKDADRRLTVVLDAVRKVDVSFFDVIEHAELDDAGGVVLTAGNRRFYLPLFPARETTVSLATVRQRFIDSEDEFAELDARFEGMVVKRVTLR